MMLLWLSLLMASEARKFVVSDFGGEVHVREAPRGEDDADEAYILSFNEVRDVGSAMLQTTTKLSALNIDRSVSDIFEFLLLFVVVLCMYVLVFSSAFLNFYRRC